MNEIEELREEVAHLEAQRKPLRAKVIAAIQAAYLAPDDRRIDALRTALAIEESNDEELRHAHLAADESEGEFA